MAGRPLDVEAALDATGERKGLGAYYTPDWLVGLLLDLTLEPILVQREVEGPDAVRAVRVIDPTCGSGNFLVAALHRIAAALGRAGVEPEAAGTLALDCVVGVDLDQRALDACRHRLLDAAGQPQHASADPEPRLWMGDAFTMPTGADPVDGPRWRDICGEVGATAGFDVVIGNPPFLNQLRSTTVFARSYGERLSRLFPGLFRGYTDAAALALVVARRLVRDGGRFSLVQPTATLASEGGAQIRSFLLSTSTLTDSWIADRSVFADAEVEVWAPVFTAAVPAEPVSVRRGRDGAVDAVVAAEALTGTTWSPLLAAAKGIPQRRWETAGTIGDIATATADFRDQYYGLIGHVYDRQDSADAEHPKLVTTGLIDPADLRWGRTPARFNKSTYLHPRVDVASLRGALRRWADARMVPKVLVATQTRVLEAIVDETGELLPSVPVITLCASSDDLWRVAALLVSPPTCAIAASRHLGSALSNDALKLSASDVMALPLPSNTAAWHDAADLFRQASQADNHEDRRRFLADAAAEMCDAFGQRNDAELIDWWTDRLPRRAANAEKDAIPPTAPGTETRRRSS